VTATDPGSDPATIMDLSGRVVLVTGASKGIGAAIVGALGRAGASVIAAYGSDHDGARAAIDALPAERVLRLSIDLSVPGAGRRLWDEALAWKGQIDVLVCNAAVMLDSPLDADDEVWDAAWRQTLAVNVREPANLMRSAARHFVAVGGGVLVTLSSWSAQRGSGNPDLIAYSASKAAIKSTAQTLARAHAADGLLVYIIAPGVVRTQMSEISAQALGGEEAVTAGLAMGEWVPPQEIAALVVFLSSGTVRHLSGATLDVNGASYIR
jgi:NAD(P)-dependent dehydrogenase (short-subunit alcohol dehydrogenase family)